MPTAHPPGRSSNGAGQRGIDDQGCGARADSNGNGNGSPDVPATSTSPSADLPDALLLILGDALDDLERTRIASENRLRSLQQVKGLEGSEAETELAGLVAALAVLEHRATLKLKHAMRAHPLGPWVKRTVGVGEKQAARLLAVIGAPGVRPNPAKLWAYCGYAPGQGKRRDQNHSYNWKAKSRAYLIAESCMKQRRSPYREVYDRERAKWADRETSDAHKHAHALRVVAKEILKDLWREARAIQPPTPALGASESAPQTNGHNESAAGRDDTPAPAA